MFGVINFVLIFTIFQIVKSELPEHCRRPPPGVTHPEECCAVPPIFKKEDLEECGIDADRSKMLKEGPQDCTKHICILKKYSLMKDDKTVDKTAIGDYLDKWVETNSEFKDAVDKAKERCLEGELPGPPIVCEPKKIGFCMMVTAFQECPTWKDTDDCKKLKEHMDDCKSFLPF